VIRSIRDKGLKFFWEQGDPRRSSVRNERRLRQILIALDAATRPEDLDLPGLRFHGLHGVPKRWSVTVSGNWRVTWTWNDGPAAVDLED